MFVVIYGGRNTDQSEDISIITKILLYPRSKLIFEFLFSLAEAKRL